MRKPHRPIRPSITIASAALALVVAACGTSRTDGGTVTTTPTTATAPAPAEVSIALDWTPNTNHIGLYVAESKGYYRDAGLTVKVLPYAETAPETLVSRGIADLGFSYQAGIAYARAAGLDVRQVFANIVRPQYLIGVRADATGIATPKDLDGKTYAGFGTPDEKPELQTVIRNAGGKGTFKTVVLDTSAYQAVYGGKADFTLSASTWEGVEARLKGRPMRYFDPTDYGFPASYSSAIAASDRWLGANGDVARRFLAATARGYADAADNPDEAAAILTNANRQSLKDPQLVLESARMLAADGFLRGASATVGTIDPTIWTTYGNYLFAKGLLADADGKPLATRPDWTDYFTNDYLPAP